MRCSAAKAGRSTPAGLAWLSGGAGLGLCSGAAATGRSAAGPGFARLSTGDGLGSDFGGSTAATGRSAAGAGFVWFPAAAPASPSKARRQRPDAHPPGLVSPGCLLVAALVSVRASAARPPRPAARRPVRASSDFTAGDGAGFACGGSAAALRRSILGVGAAGLLPALGSGSGFGGAAVATGRSPTGSGFAPVSAGASFGSAFGDASEATAGPPVGPSFLAFSISAGAGFAGSAAVAGRSTAAGCSARFSPTTGWRRGGTLGRSTRGRPILGRGRQLQLRLRRLLGRDRLSDGCSLPDAGLPLREQASAQARWGRTDTCQVVGGLRRRSRRLGVRGLRRRLGLRQPVTLGGKPLDVERADERKRQQACQEQLGDIRTKPFFTHVGHTPAPGPEPAPGYSFENFYRVFTILACAVGVQPGARREPARRCNPTRPT